MRFRPSSGCRRPRTDRNRRGTRPRLTLLASSSVAALLIGGGAAPAFACYTGSFIGGHTNAGATACIVVQNTSFTGNLSNTGTIAPGNPTDILISGSTITGSVTNSGTISGGAGIVIENSTITAQTVLAPIGIDDRGLLVATNGLGISIDSHSTVVGSAIGVNVELTGTFSGGLSNAGVILGSDDGINFEFLTTVGGGITNSGTVSGLFGLEVDSVALPEASPMVAVSLPPETASLSPPSRNLAPAWLAESPTPARYRRPALALNSAMFRHSSPVLKLAASPTLAQPRAVPAFSSAVPQRLRFSIPA
jgi:hypothetical protein